MDTQKRDLPGYETRWWGMLFIGISLLVISLDNTILNVAIPSISRDLGATSSDLQWIVDAYVLVFAALLLTMGAISDRYGRKLWLQIGLALFGIGSLAAALSTSTNMLIASRAFLGIGAAVIMPSTLSLITASFPAHERPQAIALWAAVFGLGVGIGPVVGGLLLESYEWNAVFFVNLPVIAIALVGGQYFLYESRDAKAPKIDLPGVVLSITGLFALVYGIIHAGEAGWADQQTITAFAAAVVLLGAFAIWESRTPTPMLPLHFFRNFSFTGANTALALIMFSMFGSVFFMSQYLQTVKGYTALEAGIRIVPLALTMAFMAASSARITARIGTKYTVALGILIAAAGLFYMSQMYEVDSSYGEIVVGMIILSGGLGMAVSPATDSVMGSVPESKAGIGSAMNDTTRELGGAMGVAIFGTIMNNIYTDKVGQLSQQLSAMPQSMLEAVSDSIQAAHIVAGNPQVPDFARQLILDTANAAFVDGMTSAMLIGAIVMAVSSGLVLLLLPSKVQRPAAYETVPDLDGTAVPAASAAD
ncbi:MAG: MFS transporter [Anaerolineae bacterium]|nr:MAG: MFS transporter [Anaerolineae bacterium]